ncbi:MAG: ROK family transcriptional regulator [Clostridia bacterium]
MKDTSMTTMKVKEYNKSMVYHYIYDQKTTSKQQITQNLSMSLSTVSQNLRILEDEGLVYKTGSFKSTGGRKADVLEINSIAKIAIGVAILKDMLHIVAIDLYGKIIKSAIIHFPFKSSEDYCKTVSEYINNFIIKNNLKDILGVSIATQGIVSKEGDYVVYGEILKNTNMNIEDFQKFISYPCRLEHDSKAAANLELWQNKGLQNGVVFLLNRNLGGAIIVDGAIKNGDNMRSGIVEHLCMNTDGAMCYCSKRGCLETYCSANALEQTANMPVKEFFKEIEYNNLKCISIWQEYLRYLALAIRNLSVVIDGKYIISGYIAPYFKENDIEYLLDEVNSFTAFPINRDDIILGSSGDFSQAVGAGLYYISNLLNRI